MKTDKDIIVIGDVHGSTLWQEIVKKHSNCRYVFLGDYCDPYKDIANEDVLENFKRIIEFKQENPEEVILLLGNHDIHYLVDDAPMGSRFSLELMMDIEELLVGYTDCFQCVYRYDGMLFTHAGVSRPWFEEQFCGDTHRDIADQLISRTGDTSLHDCGKARGGKHAYGGIFWADKEELNNLPPHVIQIVGHTRVPEITCRQEVDSAVYFCDCLWQEKYMLIEHRDGKRNFYQLTLSGDKESPRSEPRCQE